MQKKIIALAVAAVASSAAFAQSNVTISGRVDAYAANVTNSAGTKATAINSGGLGASFIKFAGVEDLGNGTKALFVVEHQLDIDGADAYGSGKQRLAYVGLTGNLGTAIAGRMDSLIYKHNAAFNPLFGTAVDTLSSVAAGTRIGTADRVSNAVAYVAPTIGGVTLAGAYTSNAGATDVAAYSSATRAYQLSANYKNGALAVGGVYDKVLDLTGTGNTSYGVGASYDLGVAKLLATYGEQQANHDADNTKKSMYNLGVVAPVSAAGAVIVSYGSSKFDGEAEEKRTAAVVAYKHGLSKRTAVYGGFAQASGSDNNPSGTFGGISPVTSGLLDGKANVAFAGVQHLF